jgi:hypothetical protein
MLVPRSTIHQPVASLPTGILEKKDASGHLVDTMFWLSSVTLLFHSRKTSVNILVTQITCHSPSREKPGVPKRYVHFLPSEVQPIMIKRLRRLGCPMFWKFGAPTIQVGTRVSIPSGFVLQVRYRVAFILLHRRQCGIREHHLKAYCQRRVCVVDPWRVLLLSLTSYHTRFIRTSLALSGFRCNFS